MTGEFISDDIAQFILEETDPAAQLEAIVLLATPPP
jgi:hypothetical protein